MYRSQFVLGAVIMTIVASVPAAVHAQSDGFVYLNCTWRDSNLRRSGADLYKIGNGQFDAYNDDRTRSGDRCVHIANGTSGCSLSDATFFASVTEGAGSNLYQDQVDINRISGAYMHTMILGGVLIEHAGKCEKTAAPPELQKKF